MIPRATPELLAHTSGGRSLAHIQKIAHAGVIRALRHAPARGFFFRCYNYFIKTTVSSAIVETKFGSKIKCDPTDLIQSMIFHFGMWEPNISWIMEGLLQPGDVVADVGANIGYESLLASRLVGPSGRVIAIEAEPATFEKLQSNLALNGVQNVRALNCAVSDRVGSLKLYTGNQSNIGASSTIASSDRQIAVEVKAYPLDEMLTDADRRNLRLIKMDIEGGEAIVLRRFLETLDAFESRTCLIVEASPQVDGTSWNELFHSFRKAGFLAYSIENSYSPIWYLDWKKPTPVAQLERMP
jgi:FkbM family methyltransferase